MRECVVCGNPLKKNAKKFCSSKCLQSSYWQDRKEAFEKTGCWNSHNGPAITDKALRSNYKHYVLDQRGHQCEICGNNKWMNQPIPLILDHVDGHSGNFSMDNLRLICPNCDAQTPTYKSKNRGNGRRYRRERYAAGKSW